MKRFIDKTKFYNFKDNGEWLVDDCTTEPEFG